MNCFFCDGPRSAPVRNVSYYQLVSSPIGTMSLTRRFDGQPMAKIEMDVDVTLDVCIGDDNGYHIGCAKKAGIPIKRRHNA